MRGGAIHRRRFVRGAIAGAGGAMAASFVGRGDDWRMAMAGEENRSENLSQGGPFRDRLQQALGGPWPDSFPLESQVKRVEQRDGYRLEWLSFLAEPNDRIPEIGRAHV